MPGPRPGPRRPGGLFRVVEGQELESSISGGLFFFSPATAAGGEGAGGAQGLRESWRAAGPAGVRADGGVGGGGIGWNDMTLPSKRIISVLEGEGRVSVTVRGAAPQAQRPPASPHLLQITARAPPTPTCEQPQHLPLPPSPGLCSAVSKEGSSRPFLATATPGSSL